MSSTYSLWWALVVSALALGVSGNSNPMFGEITSPGYPDSYPNDSRASWAVGVPPGYRVRLQFRYFQLEPSRDCVYDRLKVSSGGKTLGVFCGNDNSIVGNPPRGRVLTSTGNTMDLEFQSDFSNEGKFLGFLVYYEAIDVDECSVREGAVPGCEHLCHNTLGSYSCSCRHGYQLQSDGKSCRVQCQEFFSQISGELTSPEYPAPYPPNLHCNYSIHVEEGFSIALNFQGIFEVEDHPEVKCPYDNVTVSATGVFTDPIEIEYGDVVLGPLCGTEPPARIETRSHVVHVLFHADGSGQSRGWKILYTTDRIQCPDLPLLTHGTISPAQPQYRFLDRVSFTCDVGYKIMKEGRELKTFKMLCTKEGVWNKETIASCQMIDCGEPKHLENGNISVLEGSSVRNGYLTRIRYSCDPRYHLESQGDGTYTCTETRRWTNPSVRETIPYCAPVCGKPEHPVSQSTGRIFGGAAAPDGSFPWQVYLQPPRGGRGSGVLIDDRWVLTAAHVLWPKSRGPGRPNQDELQTYGVYLGDNDLEDLLASAGRPVERVYLHRSYSGEVQQYDHDVALIKMASPVRLTRHVVPACLPPAGGESAPLYQDGLLGYVAGWGVTQDQRLLNRLHYVGLPVANQGKCRAALERDQQGKEEPLRLGPGMFCAGTGLGETDSCQGDSGGAFSVHQAGGDTWYVTGLVSWGLGCGREGTYGVYTRVEHYLPWIRRVMAGEED